MKHARSKALLVGLVTIPAIAIGTSLGRAPAPPTGPLCHPHGTDRQPGHTASFESCGIAYGVDPQGFRYPGWRSWPAGPAIVAVGDSFTFGQGVAFEDAWPAQLEQLTGMHVINAGIPGAQASRIAEVVEQFWQPRSAVVVAGAAAIAAPVLASGRMRDPYAVIPTKIIYGVYANDVNEHGTHGDGHDARAFFWRRRSATRASFERLVRASEAPVYVLVLGIPGRGSAWLTRRLEDLARDAGMHVIQVEYPDDCGPLAADELHPNEQCHRAYALAVAEEMR